jgi:hypothetical protein
LNVTPGAASKPAAKGRANPLAADIEKILYEEG